MALVLKDRIKETTTTTGTGTYTLAGAVTGFEAFSQIGNGNTTYYACTDGTDFEIGIGTYTASGTTLARTTILQSSNSDSAVNWTSGTRTIFCTLPAEKMSFLDASGNLVAANASALTALNGSNIASGTVPVARIDTGTSANKIVILDGSARLPAVDGSQLTNLPSTGATAGFAVAMAITVLTLPLTTTQTAVTPSKVCQMIPKEIRSGASLMFRWSGHP